MIGPEWIYWLLGGFFFVVGVQIAFDRAHPKRWPTAAFWCLFGASICAGDHVPSWLLGAVVILAALLAGFGLTGRGTVRTTSETEREASAARKRNLLLVPALTIPFVTVLVALGGGHVTIGAKPLLAPGSQTLIGLGVATIAALAVGWMLLRPRNPGVAFVEGRRLLEAIGWAALLPQMLATLGLLFTQAGVGTQVGLIAQHVVPEHSRLFAVIVYAVGMAAFTMIMGNAFAAFPIMTAAVGWPILVVQLGAHPAPMFAIGMLAGFCGTLCTPMAANFNLVPPALLEMRDKYGQIKVQIPTAIALFVVNLCLMLLVPFR
ncbi:MAG TPA: DUF979 domain-containing protein [Candidatus Baltobacteraceae bacterium]|nr:DUF979 domain-containing protein [Candidatus Baltobacteraceae bacterium]